MANNPCGISYEQTIKTINEKVLTGNYNGRTEVMKGLMNDGMTYSEAKQVTDYYFDIYRRVAAKQKVSTPSIALNAEQKKSKTLNNMAVAYLRGEIGGTLMSDADIAHLESIYAKADLADTPTLKATYDEQAAVFVAKFLPNFSNELFRTSVYSRPLLSAVFFEKSLLSNFHARVERSISDTIWDGKKMDLSYLGRFDGLGAKSLINTLQGGIPATSVLQDEKFGINKGRLEEYSIKGTEATSNPYKGAYFQIMKTYSKFSGRLNSAPDTAGIYSNAERHMYQLLKEQYRDAGNDDKQATQKALQDMDLDDKATATEMAEKKFAELGEPARNKNGKYTSQFKVAVEEYQRLKRDNVLWTKALELSKNDFWKKNLTVASELGFGDYGVFGVQTQLLSALRNKLESKSKSKVSSAFNLWAFGFLNGASNFAEDAIERMPLYATVKAVCLQVRKGQVTDTQLQHDIGRRQKDLLVKNLTTASFFVVMKMLESLLCPGTKDKLSSSDIAFNPSQNGPCGIPIIVPPQLLPMYNVYTILHNAYKNDESFSDAALNIMPIMVQSNDMGLGGALNRLETYAADYNTAVKTGNDVKAEELKSKMSKQVIRSVADLGNSYLPIPSRAIAEAATVAETIRGVKQQQQQLPFRIDDEGKVLPSVIDNIGKLSISALGNVTGISEVMIAAKNADKNYAMDWQGRKIAQFRVSGIAGPGIQYNDNDQILIDAKVKPPYVNRLEKITYDTDSKPSHGFLKGKVDIVDKKVRYMTDEEFFNVNDALGKFNADYFDSNHDRIRQTVNTNQPIAKKDIETVFKRTHNVAIKAVEAGRSTTEEILQYIKHNWKSDRGRKLTNTEY